MLKDPRWPRASEWLPAPSRLDIQRLHSNWHGQGEEPPMLAVFGAPLNKSITPGNCQEGPQAIRNALSRFSSFDLEHGVDLRGLSAKDYGNMLLKDPEQSLAVVSSAMRAVRAANATVLLGGDNGITRPGVHGLGYPLDRCGLITLDAHLDLRDTSTGLMNGNPVRALLDDGMPGENIVQIGIQSFANSSEYLEVGREAGITVHTMSEVHSVGLTVLVQEALEALSTRVDVIYVDLDLDVMDRAFAPGCPGARPGGLSPRDLSTFAHICGTHHKVRAIDLVELDPSRDINDVTAMTAAWCLLSFASGIWLRRSVE